jgi:hypothetical protein
MAAGSDVAMRFRYLGRAALCLIQVEDREVVAWADALRQLRDAEAADTWRRNRHRPVLCTRTGAGTPLRTRVRYTHAAEDLPMGYRHGRRAADPFAAVVLQWCHRHRKHGSDHEAGLAAPTFFGEGQLGLMACAWQR